MLIPKWIPQRRKSLAIYATSYKRNLGRTQLDPSDRIQLAALAGRCGQYDCGLFFLEPIVKKNGEPQFDAPSAARIQYASLLFDLGLCSEGLRWLAGIPDDQYPMRNFIYATHLFSKWNYPDAIPLLDRYLELVPPNSYEWSVGQVNRLSALSFVGPIEAEARELMDAFERAGHRVLLANCCEILASQMIERGRNSEAKRLLNRATDLLPPSKKKDAVFVEKWRLILEFQKSGVDSYSRVLEFKKRYQNEWEVHRSLDFEWAKRHQIRSLLEYVWAGTPYHFFREKIAGGCRPEGSRFQFNVPKEIWTPIVPGISHGPKGKDHIIGANWPEQPKLRELLHALVEDFYKPKSINELFTALYPDETFEFLSSPAKVHQLLFRLRNLLRIQKIPITIQASGRFLLLTSNGRVSIDRPLDLGVAQLDKMSLIKNLLQKGPQSTQFLAESLGISHRMTRHYLQRAIESESVISPRRGIYALNTGPRK